MSWGWDSDTTVDLDYLHSTPPTIRESINSLIEREKTEEDKLDLLTAIEITSRCDATVAICREFRNSLCQDDADLL